MKHHVQGRSGGKNDGEGSARGESRAESGLITLDGDSQTVCTSSPRGA